MSLMSVVGVSQVDNADNWGLCVVYKLAVVILCDAQKAHSLNGLFWVLLATGPKRSDFTPWHV